MLLTIVFAQNQTTTATTPVTPTANSPIVLQLPPPPMGPPPGYKCDGPPIRTPPSFDADGNFIRPTFPPPNCTPIEIQDSKSNDNDNNNSGINSGLVVGAVCSGVAFLGIGTYMLIKKKKKKKGKSKRSSTESSEFSLSTQQLNELEKSLSYKEIDRMSLHQ